MQFSLVFHDFSIYKDRSRSRSNPSRAKDRTGLDFQTLKALLSVLVTRTSSCSTKAKGKEPEVFQVLVISEAEFELVMRPDLIVPTYEKKWVQPFKGEEGGK